ncbi:MAG: insulinase family protein [Bacteroidia bacterium]|nr:insulinase family protein [Bacteroidia bacterium]
MKKIRLIHRKFFTGGELLAILMFVSVNIFAQVHSGKLEVDTISKTQPQLIEKIIAQPGETIIPYEKWEFPNGLTLIIHEDHSDPIVSVVVTYHVGSARESVRKTGFAHFFEHMMFQGSDNVGPEEHFKIVSEAGGENNAGTTNDITFYYETVPSNQLEVALWLEADRMGFFYNAMTQKEFENQRDVIKNEKNQVQIEQPYGMLDEVLNQNLYPMGHPYNSPVIGYMDDLDSADVNDAKNFFLRWYGPNNATLVVAGDIESKEALKLVEKYFGNINKGPDVTKQSMNIPIIPVDKYVNITDCIFLPLTQMVFPCAPKYHRDKPALDILAIIMGQGNNSVFYKNFVKNEKAIQSVVYNNASELAGEFTIMVLAYPKIMETGMTLNETEELIKKTIEEFGEKGITDDELLRAKTQIQSGLFFVL